MKGKPWTTEQEKQLKELVAAKTPLKIIAAKFGFSIGAIRKKCDRLGLEVVVTAKKSSGTTTSKLTLPDELPSIEEMIKKTVAAVDALDSPGLDKTEVLRLRGIIAGVESYQKLLDKYLQYRDLEVKIEELTEKYEILWKKAKDLSPK